MNIILRDIFFQYERKEKEQGGGVFAYVNEVLKPNEMVGVKEEDNISLCGLKLLIKMIKKN